MVQRHEATTDRLVGIIASIKMERRSGQLMVRRGEGPTTEEGTLVFAEGQVTRASVGRRSGTDALNWLSTWTKARYVFTSTSHSADVSSLAAALPSSSLGRTGTGVGQRVVREARVDTDRLESPYPLAYGVPRPTVDLEEATKRIEQAGLSRTHRRLYLLIDGHRSAIELIPLIGKQAEEVRNMLYDLEWLGVIRILNPPSLAL